jgi:GR25 family glycosyltransferase involved in LPS biosynthesis
VEFFKNLDRIYCINLGHRKDRWTSCLQQFENLGIADKVIRHEPKPCLLGSLSRKANAQASCALAHYTLMTEALKSGCANTLILEDDFLFHRGAEWTNKKLLQGWSELPKDWDLFYLGAYFVHGYHYLPALHFSKNLVRVKTGLCNHAVAYSRQGLNKILQELKLESEADLLNFSNEFEAIDWYMVRWFQTRGQCFAPNELACIQNPGQSDIEGQFWDYSSMFASSYQTHVMGMDSSNSVT